MNSQCAIYAASEEKSPQSEVELEINPGTLEDVSIYSDREVGPNQLGDRYAAREEKSAQSEVELEINPAPLEDISIYSDPQVGPAGASEIKVTPDSGAIENKSTQSQIEQGINQGTLEDVSIYPDRQVGPNQLGDRYPASAEKSPQSQVEFEIAPAPLKDSSIYSSSEVGTSELVNLPKSELNINPDVDEILTIEVPSDEPPVKGDRIISQVTQQKGVVTSIGSSYASVLFDGAKQGVCLYANTIERLVKVEVTKQDLFSAIDLLKESLDNSKVIDLIKSIPHNLFSAAKQFLVEQEGRAIVERLRHLLARVDYELYMSIWC